MIGLLILALVVGTGQMTAQPTQAFVPVVAPVIAKGTATAGALLYVYFATQQQQHEKALQNLEVRCKMPTNKNTPLCRPFIDNKKPLPLLPLLADIQRWVTEKCKKDASCIQTLVREVEELFTKLTGTTIHLGESLCKNPTFHSLAKSLGQYLLAREFENYCKNKGILPPQSSTSKRGGGTGGAGGTPPTSSANPPSKEKTSTSASTVRKTPTSSSAKPSTGETGNSQVPVGTQTDLGQRVKTLVYSSAMRLRKKIQGYLNELERRKNIPTKKLPQFEQTIYESVGKKPSHQIREELRNTKEKNEILQKLIKNLNVLQERTRALKKMISKGVPASDIENENNAIQRELEKLLLEYNEKVLGDKDSLGTISQILFNRFKERMTSKYPENTPKGKEIRKLIREIEILRDRKKEYSDQLVKKNTQHTREEIQVFIIQINEEIETKSKEIGNLKLKKIK
jgi:hypothetical protein